MKIKNKIHQEKIEKAIAEFESHVDFEFVPVIARKSSYVEHISWVLSLLFLLLFIGLIDFVFAYYMHDSFQSPMPYYIAAPFLAFLCGVLLDKSDAVDRFFISKKERVRQVQQAAELTFFHHRLHEVVSQNSLMLYISIMERQIVLIHDPKIKFTKMQQIDDEILRILQKAFKNKNYENGLLEAIEHLKMALKAEFPLKNGANTDNFVPNKLIWID